MKILGHYIDTAGKRNVLYMKMSCTDLMSLWNRCGEAADFGAHYVVHTGPNKRRLENSASTILNELIENAAKYSNDEPDNIEVYTYIAEDKIVFQVDSLLDKEQYDRFKELAGDIEQCEDLGRLYIQKMQAVGENGENEFKSGLGLLMIVYNFNTTLGFKFDEPEQAHAYRVSVQASLPAAENTLRV